LDIQNLCAKKKNFRLKEKEKQAEAKYEALKLQVQLVRDFAVQLSNLDVSVYPHIT
jgi:hypothetical protein